VVPDLAECRALCPDLDPALDPASVLADRRVRAAFARVLAALAARSTGSSNRITGAILLDEPPSLDLNEVTDKGSVNQRALLGNRAALVEELYARPPSPRVIRPTGD
jgi:feruloyl-CoA synthase